MSWSNASSNWGSNSASNNWSNASSDWSNAGSDNWSNASSNWSNTGSNNWSNASSNWSSNNWSNNLSFGAKVGSMSLSLSGVDESVVLSELGFEVVSQRNVAWVWDGVVDVLDGSAVQRGDESVFILFNDVQSGFEFTQFSSQLGVGTDKVVVLWSVINAQSGDFSLEVSVLSSDSSSLV